MIAPDELRSFALFKNIAPAELEALAQLLRRVSFSPEAILFEKGDEGDFLLLILSGEVGVFMRDDQGHTITFRTLKTGQTVGEFSLLDRKPRSAAAAAATPVEGLVLHRDDLLHLLHEHTLVGVEMMRSLAERIRYTTSYLERLTEALELLSNHAYDEALREMALSADEGEIQQLIAAFVDAVHHVQEHERAGK